MTYQIRVSCPSCTSETGLHGPSHCFGWNPQKWTWLGDRWGGTDQYESKEEAQADADDLNSGGPNPLGWVYEVFDVNDELPPLPRWEPPKHEEESPEADIPCPF